MSGITSRLVPSIPLKTAFQRRSSAPNMENLSTISLKSGSQPTIVAIPLYIRNPMSSKYPSIVELLQSAFMQTDVQNNKHLDTNSNSDTKQQSIKNNVNEIKSNYTTQHYQTQQKILDQKYYPKEESHKQKYREELTANESEGNGFNEPTVPQQSRSNVYQISNSNHNTDTHNKFTPLRPMTSQSYLIEDQRKQNPNLYDLQTNGNIQSNNNNNQYYGKTNDNSDNDGNSDSFYTNSDAKREPTAHSFANYPPIDINYNYRDDYKSKSMERYAQNTSPEQTQNDKTDDNMEFRFIDSDNNYSQKPEIKNINFNYNNNNNNYDTTVPKSAEIQSFSYSKPYETRPTYSPVVYTQSHQTSRPVSNKHNYDNDFATISKPMPISSSVSNPSLYSSIADPPNGYNQNIQSIPSTNYNTNFQPIITYANQKKSKNSYNSVNSVSYPIQSSASKEYSISDDPECDENNDYKSLSVTPKPDIQSASNGKSNDQMYGLATKVIDGDHYETEEFDPTKMDLKIIHLPISILRRLVNSGHISLPGYQ
ncbi:putative uncharacterized protein DDB_G0282129 [Oppia nitens]|uniref:putative uncharacterized protein DDB_G0282129 n=1 Tax=Oppia nitens TaxID=1686743 RepID=UPI0023DCA807|nr:putative uncharacterized protein DDB_G0282129 [Oppia nitens]